MSKKVTPDRITGMLESRFTEKGKAMGYIHRLVNNCRQFTCVYEFETSEWVVCTPYIPTK